MPKRTTATISLELTRDAWKDLESALMDRAIKAGDHVFMRERLDAIRRSVDEQVRYQHPRW